MALEGKNRESRRGHRDGKRNRRSSIFGGSGDSRRGATSRCVLEDVAAVSLLLCGGVGGIGIGAPSNVRTSNSGVIKAALMGVSRRCPSNSDGNHVGCSGREGSQASSLAGELPSGRAEAADPANKFAQIGNHCSAAVVSRYGTMRAVTKRCAGHTQVVDSACLGVLIVVEQGVVLSRGRQPAGNGGLQNSGAHHFGERSNVGVSAGKSIKHRGPSLRWLSARTTASRTSMLAVSGSRKHCCSLSVVVSAAQTVPRSISSICANVRVVLGSFHTLGSAGKLCVGSIAGRLQDVAQLVHTGRNGSTAGTASKCKMATVRRIW